MLPKPAKLPHECYRDVTTGLAATIRVHMFGIRHDETQFRAYWLNSCLHSRSEIIGLI